MPEVQASIRLPKSVHVRLVRCAVLLFGVAAVLAGIVFAFWFKAAHPADIVEVEIHSLPLDVNYVCLASCDSGRTRLLDQYRQDLLSCFHDETPDGRAHRPSPVSCSCAGIAWRPAERYLVLWRDLRGRWYRRSVEANRVRSVPADGDSIRTRMIIELLPSDRTETVDADFLTPLGIAHLEGDDRPIDCPPGIHCFHEFEGRLDEAWVLLYQIEWLIPTGQDKEAVDRARVLARNVPKMLSTIRTPTPEQEKAAARLVANCENFSIAPGAYPVNTLKVTAHWESLLRTIYGSE